MNRLAALLVLVALSASGGPKPESYSDKLAALIHPAKLAKLRDRGANPQFQKAIAVLAEAASKKQDPGAVCVMAIQRVKMERAAGELTLAALLRNLDAARVYGCLDSAGLSDLRRGKAPTIKLGGHKGDLLSVEHIIPRAVAPELDNVIANLEFVPLRMGSGKGDRIGDRQRDLARKLHAAGLLSEKGLEEILRD